VSAVTTVALIGVGGQGVLLAASVIAETAAAEGLHVKASEVHGMAQRGGSVVSTVRFGEHVWSPVSPHHADVVIATEVLEGHRGLSLLEPGGALVCAATTRIAPGGVLRGEEEYPVDLEGAAAARGVRLVAVDAEGLAREAGTARAINVVLLGAASVMLPFGERSWQRGLKAAVPTKILEVNQRAFALGRSTAGGPGATGVVRAPA
jgi:indolepyruvate ferredoxin oxidoreductase beta subunit